MHDNVSPSLLNVRRSLRSNNFFAAPARLVLLVGNRGLTSFLRWPGEEKEIVKIASILLFVFVVSSSY